MSSTLSLKSKLPNLKTTIFSIVGNLAKKHNATNLAQGFPDFKTDSKLLDMVTHAMKDGYNQYAPMPGLLALRETIAIATEKLYGRYYNPETEITITTGATQAIYTAITAFVAKDDEVIVLKPAYDCYEPAIELAGGVPVLIQMKGAAYKIDWQEFKNAITSKTKMVIINTPHNPSGQVLSKKDMLALEACLANTNIVLLSDEVYEHIIFDGTQHQSASRFKDLASRSIICSSFGKTFHITGWKMGYCVAPEVLMKEFRKVHQFNVFSVNHPAQLGINNYLKDENTYLNLANFYQEKRDYFLNAISESRFKFTTTKGTFFQLLDYSDITDENDVLLNERLIKDYKLASIPISVFNIDEKDDKMLRFCFAKTKETIDKAAEILNSI